MNRQNSFPLCATTPDQTLAEALQLLCAQKMCLDLEGNNSQSKSPQTLYKISAKMWWFIDAWRCTHQCFPDDINDILIPLNQEIELFNQNSHYPTLPVFIELNHPKEHIERCKDYTIFMSCLVQNYLHINGLNPSFSASTTHLSTSYLLYGGLRKAYLGYVKHSATIFPSANLERVNHIIREINIALGSDDQLKSLPQFLALPSIPFDQKMPLDALKDSLEAKCATLAYLLHEYEPSSLEHDQNVIARISPQTNTLQNDIQACSEDIREHIRQYPIGNLSFKQDVDALLTRQSHLNLLPPSSPHFSRARQNDSQKIRYVPR